jgi:hypothetical protein
MGMAKLPPPPDALEKRRAHMSFEDWNSYTSGNVFTTTTAGAGAAAVSATLPDGILVYSPTDSTLNREVYVATTNSLFAILASKPLMCEFSLQYTEANTNKAIIGCGFMSAVGAASLQDTTGLPKASFTGAVIFKVPNSTVWQTCSSVGTTQTTTTSTTTAGGTQEQILKIVIEPVSATIAEVTYYVNDQQLLMATGRPGQNKIKDQLTYTGAAAMQLFACCKNGSTTPETLNEDYRGWSQHRGPLYGLAIGSY